MSELAFNMNGEPFEVPPVATGWRVRRMKHKGAPEVVYGRDGLPLVLPIEAAVDDLRNAVGTPGRYRVDPVDGHRPIPNAPAGYVFVHDGDAPVALTSSSHKLPPPSDDIVIEAMRLNTEIARSVVDRFPQMLAAAATLLRAADGAGLPAREPRTRDDDDDVYEEPTNPGAGGFDLNSFVAQVVPLVLAGMANGKMKLPVLKDMLDWRKAAPQETRERDVEPAPATPVNTAPAAEPFDVSKTEPAHMAHFLAIQNALEPEEAAIAREVAASIKPADLRAWFDVMIKLTVPEAVEQIRQLIAGNKRAVS